MVEVVVYLGVDEESEKALQAVKRAAAKLEEEGIPVSVTTIHILTLNENLPIVRIGDWEVAGRAPSVEEVEEAILATALLPPCSSGQALIALA